MVARRTGIGGRRVPPPLSVIGAVALAVGIIAGFAAIDGEGPPPPTEDPARDLAPVGTPIAARAPVLETDVDDGAGVELVRPPVSGHSIDDPTLESTRTRPRPGTERAHYERYLAIFSGDDPGAVEAAVARFHASEVEDAEKVAILRASFDAPSSLCAELFLAALEAPPPDPLPSGALPNGALPSGALPGVESVPAFAFRYLGERIEEDPVVREILEVALFDPVVEIEPRGRRRAIYQMVRTADADQLSRLRPTLAAESDPLTRASIASALAVHPDRAAALRLADQLDLALPEPDSTPEE